MLVKRIALAVAITVPLFSFVYADEMHGGSIYHALQLETGIGATDNGSNFADWDFDGWVGSDENKLWLKSEGERTNSETEQAEFWAMYSRNITNFWDFQIGIRYDAKPDSLTYAVGGFNGLAPYFLETQAHLFVSDDGDVSARIRQETELLFTQKLITEPYYEINIYAQDVAELDIGAGLADAELGIQTHYELSRTFAPYIDIKYERKFGETAAIAERHGEDRSAIIGSVGIRLLF